MDPAKYQRAKDLFLRAVQLLPQDRPGFLDNACAEDDALRTEVASMLADHERGEQEPQETVAAPARRQPATSVPDRIGPYKIISVIGEGGMGTVYLAEQEKPIHRKVALKIIKLGMDTRQVIARFEAEREALALMNHPHVAKVLDAGTTETGRPFFAMEYVEGVALTAYCDAKRLSMPQRLELFVQVCQAIQHAHQKGIIHRDIKPSNVLVCEVDGKASVKVIDFGVAKATQQRLTEATYFTEQGQFIGTPAYMSPEQADALSMDIDTRTDIYSLGVLLYEMLVGALPFDSEALRRAALTEIVRIIREVDPPRPSSRLGSLGGTSTTIADLRSTSTGNLARLLRGDLDWIVMKCLEKDRTRRYETATALVEEIHRYLNHEPVLAGPPSVNYRLRKFVRRNRVAVTAAGVVVLALVVGLSFATYGLVQARTQRKAAEAALAAERVALDAATKSAAEAKQRAEELEQVAGFQAEQLSGIDAAIMGRRLRTGLLERARTSLLRSGVQESEVQAKIAELETLVAGADFTGLGLSMLDLNVFKRTAAAIERQFAEQPLVRARLYQTLASTARDLGLLDRATRPQGLAVEIRMAELGEEHPDTVYSLLQQGHLFFSQGKFAEAEPLYSKVLEIHRRTLGSDDNLTLLSTNAIGFLYQRTGRLADAERCFREALDGWARTTGVEHADALTAMDNLGHVYHRTRKRDQAEAQFRKALEIKRRVLGNDHPSTLISVNNVGWALQFQYKCAQAEPFFREALEGNRRLYGDDAPETLMNMANLGSVLHMQEKFDEAARYLGDALGGRRRVLGPNHPDTVRTLMELGMVRGYQGRNGEAEQHLREAVERRAETGDTWDWDTIRAWAGFLAVQGRPAEAEPYLRKLLELAREKLGDDHFQTNEACIRLGLVLRDQGKLDEAQTIADEAIRRARSQLPQGDWLLGYLLYRYGLILSAAGRMEEAEKVLEEAYEIFAKQQNDQTAPKIPFVLRQLIVVCEALDAKDSGKGHAQKAAKFRDALGATETRTTLPDKIIEYDF